MRLAFVIPAYNEEVLIGRCLEALLREIERAGCEAEVVVVNNASTIPGPWPWPSQASGWSTSRPRAPQRRN